MARITKYQIVDYSDDCFTIFNATSVETVKRLYYSTNIFDFFFSSYFVSYIDYSSISLISGHNFPNHSFLSDLVHSYIFNFSHFLF